MAEPATPFGADMVFTDEQLALDKSLAHPLIWTASFLMILAVGMTSLRLSARLCVKLPANRRGKTSAVGLDDYLMLAATLFMVVLAGFIIVGAKRGLGTHIWIIVRIPTFNFRAAEHLVKLNYGAYSAYAVATSLTKLSIIASYLRIFPGKIFRRLMYVLGVAIVIQAIIFVLVVVFACTPPEGSWNWSIPRRKCINIRLFFYVSSALNVASDFLLWGAPIPVFWRSAMPQRQKIELSGLYAIGLVSCLAGLFRLGQLKGLGGIDVTYEGAAPLNCSMAEVSFGITCACVPPLRPVFRLIKQRIRKLFGCTEPRKTTPSPNSSESRDYLREFRKQDLKGQGNSGLDMDEFERKYMGSSSVIHTPAQCYSTRGSNSATRSSGLAFSSQGSARKDSLDPFPSSSGSVTPSTRRTPTHTEIERSPTLDCPSSASDKSLS
ncbi:uncharacterized protein L3040_004314 [Drepanopeziza brunnea f. sp. 'multigermtubi']|uniref:uncharacterized protein n=1 Tax=Drepanopeziza brunnea f. sp. 'multigermtubi' TaxID=698441 RepID=UPI0023A5AFBD|nr:hypothetical protein L3040_004314 [Drepanopeziza brunnea f. sp. 'multigermtubi']